MPGSITPQSYTGQDGRSIGTLHRSEKWWRDQYYDLKHNGYKLRPRYNPDWIPSWRGSSKGFFALDDGQPNILRAAMDATRQRDGKHVMLKKVLPEEGPYELQIAQLFSSPEVARDPRNHCVPLLDAIEIPNAGQKLMVMPFLCPFNNPRFQTFGEFMAFFMQICEGVQFMHERNIAHRDCTANNIMFDPSGMYPNGFYPMKINRNRDFRAKQHTRTQRPPRYYLIDFGLSRQYPSRNALDEPLRGGDKSAPEHRSRTQCNPFHTDIYYLGNLIRQKFTQKYYGFEFMQDLIDKMTHINPAKRPSIEEVISNVSRIQNSLSGFKLRSTIIAKHDSVLNSMFRRARQALRTVRYICSHKAAIPGAS